jgi:hypothetical protein
MGRDGNGDGGDLEGWESARAWVGGGESGASGLPTPRFLTCREAPARLIRAIYEGAGTGLPAFLLDSKTSRRLLGRNGASPKTMPAPKTLPGSL